MPAEIERAVVQIMTYLVENEQAALIIPARLLSQLHPHYREVMQLLATQAADEARHVEVFTRRALLSGGPLGTSSAGGRASLQTLLDEPDFTTASFLLSVLGEGTFLDLLRFIARPRPRPGHRRRDQARAARRGPARGVRRGAHGAPGPVRPAYLGTLRQSVERRHAALRDTAGLNAEVFDSLVLLAAGSWSPEAIRRGWQRGPRPAGPDGRGPPQAAGLHRLPRRRGRRAVRPAHPQLHVIGRHAGSSPKSG